MLYERSIIVAKNAVRADVIETPLEYISKSKASILIQSNNTSFELPAIRVCIAVRWLFLQWTTECYDRLTFNDTASVVSYWRKYVHEVLVNRLGGLSLPRKSVVRLTDRPDMTFDINRGRKTTIQYKKTLHQERSENEGAGKKRKIG